MLRFTVGGVGAVVWCSVGGVVLRCSVGGVGAAVFCVICVVLWWCGCCGVLCDLCCALVVWVLLHSIPTLLIRTEIRASNPLIWCRKGG